MNIETLFIFGIVHLVFTCIMVGVIWVIQLVHYPSFHFIDSSKYRSFQDFHMQKISFIVVPAMVLELASGLIVLYLNFREAILVFISMIMLIAIWIITAVFFVNLHGKLTLGYDKLTVNSLVKINWLRTGLWTSRLLVLLYDILF